jgi:hypothetical protein
VELPPPPKPSFVFPIMKLPPELRLMVFDQLFLDLTVRRQRFMMYHNEEKLLHKHQVNDFRPYTNLLLTCNELSDEAKKLWEKQYLGRCCFYFWHISKLYDLAMVVDKMGKPYTDIKYVLRSQWAEAHVSRFCLAATVARLSLFETEYFMSCQPGISPDYPDVFEEQFLDRIHGSAGRYRVVDAGIYEATDENPVRAVVEKDEAGKTFARGEYAGPESCEISTHEDDTSLGDGGHRRDCYAQMQGKFSGIFWGGYDAAIGYGKFKLWEAVPSCPGPGHCYCENWDNPDNRFDCSELVLRDIDERAALMRRWCEEIVCDRKWLNLGGHPQESVGDLVEYYGIEDWLDFHYWSGLADGYWASWDFDEDEDTEGEDTQGEDTQEEGVEDEENEEERQREDEEDGGGSEREDESLEWYSPSR